MESEEVVRAEARDWLARHWHRDLPSKEWLAAVVDSGWAAPSWPTKWYGRDLTPELGRIADEEFRLVDAPGSGQDAYNLWANTVLAFGSDELKRRFLRPLMVGEVAMCLLYSEPGSGSDLASVQTRADRDGDEWIVNGQKVWTSGARHADYALLIARTNWDVPKHRGISFFFFPMRQPGVEVRPIRQATGDARFNEVFLTDARVPDANLLGGLNEGWWVLQTALAYERVFMGGVARRFGGESERAARSPDSEASAPVPDLELVDLARQLGRNRDPMIRQGIARLYGMRMVNRWNGERARAELAQGTSSSIASLGKLAMSGLVHTAGRLQESILGAEAMLDGPDWPRSADGAYALLNAYFTSIGGGTDQVQRNIIGERLLGLPKEPEVDKNVPFREVRKSPAVIRPR